MKEKIDQRFIVEGWEGDADSISCCGIIELDGMDENPAEVVYGFNEQMPSGRYAFAIFSDIVRKGKSDGLKLARYITRHKLGKIRSSSVKKNRNTGSMIQMWIWEVDQEALAKHSKKFTRSDHLPLDEDYDDSDNWDF